MASKAKDPRAVPTNGSRRLAEADRVASIASETWKDLDADDPLYAAFGVYTRAAMRVAYLIGLTAGDRRVRARPAVK